MTTKNIPLGSDDERVLLPYHLPFFDIAGGDEAFSFLLIEEIDLHLVRPLHNVQLGDNSGRWIDNRCSFYWSRGKDQTLILENFSCSLLADGPIGMRFEEKCIDLGDSEGWILMFKCDKRIFEFFLWGRNRHHA